MFNRSILEGLVHHTLEDPLSCSDWASMWEEAVIPTPDGCPTAALCWPVFTKQIPPGLGEICQTSPYQQNFIVWMYQRIPQICQHLIKILVLFFHIYSIIAEHLIPYSVRTGKAAATTDHKRTAGFGMSGFGKQHHVSARQAWSMHLGPAQHSVCWK